MKNGIRSLFVLSFFVLVFIFSSCATTEKKLGTELIPEEQSESDISAKTKDNEPKKEEPKLILTPSVQEPAISPVIKPKLSAKPTEPNIETNDSVSSISDPKPVTDKPELELIIVAEDQEYPVTSDSSKDEDKTSPKTEPSSKDESSSKGEPLSKNKASIQSDTPAASSTQKTETKKTPFSASNSQASSPPPVSEPSSPVPELKPPKLNNSNVKENPPDIVVSNEKDGLSDVSASNAKLPESEAAKFFSEFPSTEPYEITEEKASRSVKLYTGQRLEVLYPGEGWVYLGESTAQKGIKYQQRKLQNGTSIFHFGAANEGSYILNFSYFDVFSDNFISDSIAVYVETAKTKLSDTVKAPDYKGSISTAKSSPNENKAKTKDDGLSKTLQGSAIKKDTSPVKNENNDSKLYDSSDLLTVVGDENVEKNESIVKTDVKSAQEALDKIRAYISEGNAANALNSADDFFKNYSVNLDEALFLRGQAYELNGPNKNVKKALEAYQTLTKAYPESKFWDKADARIRYIKKFYIDIK